MIHKSAAVLAGIERAWARIVWVRSSPGTGNGRWVRS